MELMDSAKLIKNYSNIPVELKSKNRWILYKLVWDEKRSKYNKVPYQTNGYKADPTNKKHHTTFAEVVQTIQHGGFDGIGFSFVEGEGITGIDLDNVIVNGEIIPEAQKILDKFKGAYIEKSISGNGLHIICIGKKPGAKCKKSFDGWEIEIYDKQRYFTMSGDVLGDNNRFINYQAQIHELYNTIFEEETKAKQKQKQYKAHSNKKEEVTSGDVQIIIDQLKLEPWVKKMFETGQHKHGSDSEADLRLCGIIGKLTDSFELIDKVFRKSALYRPKWDEKRGTETYGELTINKVLESKQQKADELKNYSRIGDTHYEKFTSFDKDGNPVEVLEKRNRQTIIDDFGKDALRKIKKLKTFVNVPAHEGYERIVGRCYNLYNPIKHLPCEGDFPTIKKLFLHIYGEQIEMGYDYFQLLYQRPTQILPVQCWVSEENGTGKTTGAEFFKMVFGDNAGIISLQEFTSDFNGSFATKLVVAIEEGLFQDAKQVEKIKKLSTDSTIWLRKMQREHQQMDYFGKFIIMSNHEDKFIKVTKHDIRFWVRRLRPFENFDPNFKSKLKQEIPAFLHFLCNRELSTQNEHRAWFKPELLKTDALETLQKESRSKEAKELISGIVEFMESRNMEKLEATATDLKLLIFDRNPKIERVDILRALKNELGYDAGNNRKYRHWNGEIATGKAFNFYYDEISSK